LGSGKKFKKLHSVLMETEGTYPFQGGGVSVWCDILCRQMKNIDFYLVAVTGSGGGAMRYPLPPNIREMHHISLWEESSLFVSPRNSEKSRYTTDSIIEARFLPLFQQFLNYIITARPVDDSAASILLSMYRYFRAFDYRETFRSQLVWESFKEQIRHRFAHQPAEIDNTPVVADMINSLQLLYHFLTPLSINVPRTTISHTSAAGFCGIAGIIAKLEYGTPMLVTDHGVYIRERYLAISASELTPFVKKFLINLSAMVSRLSYQLADQISPVCDFNRKWEIALGAPEEKIRTIYNGIDPEKYYPAEKPVRHPARPTVVAAAHINRIKDIITMIESCHVVRMTIPDVLYIVYGSTDTDPEYAAECRQRIAELNLEYNFILAGLYKGDTPLYNQGDISIITSVSEGFPYALLEAMACARPVVATDVGGVREALRNCGILVRPRDVNAVADAVINLLQKNELREMLGRMARERVLKNYQISFSITAYRETYELLSAKNPEAATPVIKPYAEEYLSIILTG
jgi:glycosyltransferase involved in cell wall biosynthesis